MQLASDAQAQGLAAAHRAAVEALSTQMPGAATAHVAHLERLLADDPTVDDFDVVNVGLVRVRARVLDGNLQEAIAIADETVARARGLGADDASRRLLVQALLEAADTRSAAGRLVDAGPLIREAIEVSSASLGRMDPDTASAWNSLGMWLRYRGEIDEARHAYREASLIIELVGNLDDRAALQHNVASLDQLAGDLDRAEISIRRAIDLREEDSPGRAADFGVLGVILAESGRYAEAAAAYDEARRGLVARFGDQSIELAYLLANEAVLFHRRGVPARARHIYDEALVMSEVQLGLDHVQTGVVLANSARLAMDSGDRVLATRHAQRAVAILAGEVDPELPSLRAAYAVLFDLEG